MHLYLLALNMAAGRIETFALSRCRSIEGSGQHFARPVGFHAPAFFKDALGISQADKPWKVRLLFAREVATYIRERVWHTSRNCGSVGTARWSSACKPPVARN